MLLQISRQELQAFIIEDLSQDNVVQERFNLDGSTVISIAGWRSDDDTAFSHIYEISANPEGETITIRTNA